MNSDNPMKAMLKDQHARDVARLADHPKDRLANMLVKNREQALVDLQAATRQEEG